MGKGRNMAWHPPPLSYKRAAVLLRRHGLPCNLYESKQTLQPKHGLALALCKPRLGKSLTVMAAAYINRPCCVPENALESFSNLRIATRRNLNWHCFWG